MIGKAIALYKIISAELALDGSAVTIGLQLRSAEQDILGEHSITVNLPAGVRQAIRDAVLADLATFESNTGWTRFVSEVSE